jgi:phosphate transport system permease protein
LTAKSEGLPKVTRPSRAGDRIFSALVTGAGILILAILAGVAVFLLYKGWPALTAKAEELPDDETFLHYVWPLAFGTVLSSTIAVIIAVPLAVGVALFITYFAPKRIANTLGALVDLLAAIPSVIYGLWGIAVLGPAAVGLQQWLYDHLDFLPFFKGPPSPTGRTMFVLGIVLAVMILPIISAIVREVFAQTPRSLREGSLALGATRWEMIRMTVLPFGRPAIISASMLGLGRALGETMAVALILSVSGGATFNLISSGNPSTIAANIALNFPESSGLAVNLLIATGLVLFGITLLVNAAARLIISRQIRG